LSFLAYTCLSSDIYLFWQYIISSSISKDANLRFNPYMGVVVQYFPDRFGFREQGMVGVLMAEMLPGLMPE
jgi:hypothetical protein